MTIGCIEFEAAVLGFNDLSALATRWGIPS